MTAGTRKAAWWIAVVLLVGATAAATGVGVWEWTVKARTPSPVADHADVRQDVTEAARAGTIKILSYSAATVEQDVAAAAAVTTGDFASYYKQFTHDVVIPASRQKGVTTTATVPQAGVVTLSPDKAMILVFVNQRTTSREKPDGSAAASSVRVGMREVNGEWLIESFDPV